MSVQLRILILLALVAIVGVGIFFYLQQTNQDPGIPPLPSLSPEEEAQRKIQLNTQQAGATYQKIALGTLSACEELADPTYKKICIDNTSRNEAVASGAVALCDTVTGTAFTKTSCIRDTVVEKSLAQSSAQVCDEANDATIASECQVLFYALTAVAKEDVSICATADKEEIKVSCVNYYEQVRGI